MDYVTVPAEVMVPKILVRYLTDIIQGGRADRASVMPGFEKVLTGGRGPELLAVYFESKPRVFGLGPIVLLMERESLKFIGLSALIGPMARTSALEKALDEFPVIVERQRGNELHIDLMEAEYGEFVAVTFRR